MKKYLLISLFFLFLYNEIFAQNLNIDSLISVVEKKSDDTSKVNLLNIISEKLLTKDLTLSAKFADQAIQLSEKLDYIEGMAMANKNLGGISFFKSDYTQAQSYFLISLEQFRQIGDKAGESKVTNNLGATFSSQGLFEEALRYYFISLKIRDELKDTTGIASTYNSISGEYYNQGKIKDGFDFCYKALNLNKKIKNEKGLGTNYIRMGSLYLLNIQATVDTMNRVTTSLETKKAIYAFSDSSLTWLNHAEEIFVKRNNLIELSKVYELKGRAYSFKNELDSASANLKKSLEYREKLGNRAGIAGLNVTLANIEYLRKSYSKAKSYADLALKLAQELNLKKVESDTYELLADISFQQNNTEKAFEYLRMYITSYKALNNEENTKKFTQMQMQHEFDKERKQQEMLAEKQRLEQNEKLRRQKIVTIFFVIGFSLMIILALVVLYSYRQKQKANILLEEKNTKILQQNALLNQQKEEIESQRDEIEQQRDTVIAHKDKIEHQNKQITDSILYAKRIQEAVLPPDDFINKFLKEYFILFKPRDIVSGDFYWTYASEGRVFLAAVDCTGHGVPGAFMSMLGISFLNEIITKKEILDIKAGDVLNDLRDKIKSSLRQTGKDNEAKDGMDMALCAIDFKNGKLQYAGAQNPLIIIRNGEIIHLKGDRMPIGIYIKEKESFATHEIDMLKGDVYYMFSDGFEDQFGGPHARKFMIKNLKELLLEISSQPMPEQKRILEDTLHRWINQVGSGGEQFEQVDDILVLGLRYV